MIDAIPESGDGLFYSLAAASAAAEQMRAEGRETKVVESLLHVGQWIVYATPKPELPEDTSSKVVEDVQAPTVKDAPAELETKSATVSVSSMYHSHAEAEAEAKTLQAEGRKTVVRHSGFHPDCWSVYSSKLSEDSTSD